MRWIRRGMACGRDALVLGLAIATAGDLMLSAWWGRDPGWFWMDLRGWPAGAESVVLASFVAAVAGSPWWGGRLRTLARGVVGACAALCAADAVRIVGFSADQSFVRILPGGSSACLALVLAAWVWCSGRPISIRAWILQLGLMPIALGIGVLVGAMIFGWTDYRRPAEVAVVFGARVMPSGAPSTALADRTRTAIALYDAGLVEKLLFSGGRGEGAPLSEPEAMRRMARAAGVPDEAILLDEGGANTLASVREVGRLTEERGWERCLMVSHGYHLARIKLFSERQGLQAFTVPARESRLLLRYPWFLMREVAALVYWYPSARTLAPD